MRRNTLLDNQPGLSYTMTVNNKHAKLRAKYEFGVP